MPAEQRPHLGIAHVPEGRQVFASLSVLENLEMGAYTEAGRRNWKRNLERIYALMPVLERALHEAGLEGRVEVLATTCRNRCDYGPSLNVYPGPVFYNGLDRKAIHDIVAQHLAGDCICDEWLFRPRIEVRQRR